MEFRIDYLIDDAEWARTKELRGDPESDPIFHAFFGDLRISADGHNLFQVDDNPDSESKNMSVADLAVSLTQMLLDGFPYSDSSQFVFREGDGALEVYFRLVGNDVIVSCNRRGTDEIVVDVHIFSQGVYVFLKRFVAEITVKVPDVFGWGDLRILADIERVIMNHEQMTVHR